MKRTLGWIVFTAALVGTGVAPGHGDEIVELHLRGRYFLEPATVRVTVAVAPNAENRILRVAADGEELYRSSDFNLNGADEKRLHSVQFKNLPAGQYMLRAEVYSNDALRGVATQEMHVTGAGQR